MTCAEFQRELPDFLEEGGASELRAHLNVCPICSGLVASLQSIVNEARFLQDSAEPSPRRSGAKPRSKLRRSQTR